MIQPINFPAPAVTDWDPRRSLTQAETDLLMFPRLCGSCSAHLAEGGEECGDCRTTVYCSPVCRQVGNISMYLKYFHNSEIFSGGQSARPALRESEEQQGRLPPLQDLSGWQQWPGSLRQTGQVLEPLREGFIQFVNSSSISGLKLIFEGCQVEKDPEKIKKNRPKWGIFSCLPYKPVQARRVDWIPP